MAGSHHFEDLAVGAAFRTAAVTVTEDAIIRFGMEWDFQPFHVDREAARRSTFGGLVASGMQTLGLTLRLFNQLAVLADTALTGLGLDRVRWTAPVRPGDTIHALFTVQEVRPTRQPDRGVVVFAIKVLNDAEPVCTAELSVLVARRATDAAPREESVVVEVELDATAERAWVIVGDFAAVGAWAPGIRGVNVAGSGVGATRALSLGTGELVERLVACDHAARSLRYSIVSGPLPVEGYEAELRVRDLPGNRCAVAWSARYRSIEANASTLEAMFRKSFAKGLKSLGDLLVS